jgi:Raf kinase inhibitor-like YbhB/YbcL family protein
MRKALAVSLFLLAGCGMALAQGAPPAGSPRQPPMGLTSSSFTDGGVIPDKYTQNSPNPVSPALAWTNAPAGTQSFAIIMHDPDTAPGKSPVDILHWMAFNIPATTMSLPEGVPNTATLPDGTIQPNARNGKPGFMGPGAGGAVYHHYTIELFALDTKLTLGADATRAQVMAAMEGHVIGKAAVEGRFHR